MNCFVAIAAALVLAQSFPARGASAPDFAPLASLIRHTKGATALPSGTAVAVVKDGRIVYEGYFGYADVRARKPVTRDTVFYIASATKPFFALNALLKEHAGELDTSMSLQQMFPDIRFAGIDAKPVTMKDLLVHTSGVDNQPLGWAAAFSGVHDADSLRSLVAASRPDETAARGTFNYTNVGYNIVSVWLDRRLAVPWQQQLDRAIFKPLGMQHTTAYVSRAEASGWALAKPYSFASAQPREPLYLVKTDDTMQAAGGMVSTAPDLARFLIAELSKGDEVLPAAVIERSHQSQAALSSHYLDFPRTGYAWGWYTGEYKGRKMLHHFGGFAGFHAHLSFMPDENIALVVLNNEDFLSARLTNLIADYVYGVLLRQPGTGAEVAHRFDELQAKARKMHLAVVERRHEIEARAWSLSQPREAYVGTYSNALLGDMTVRLDKDQRMVVRWGQLSAVATGGEQKDRVRIEFVPNSGAFLHFAVDDGKVSAISFERMVFSRGDRH